MITNDSTRSSTTSSPNLDPRFSPYKPNLPMTQLSTTPLKFGHALKYFLVVSTFYKHFLKGFGG